MIGRVGSQGPNLPISKKQMGSALVKDWKETEDNEGGSYCESHPDTMNAL